MAISRDIQEFQRFCVAVYTKVREDVPVDGVYFGASVCRIEYNGDKYEIKREDSEDKSVDDMASAILARMGIIKSGNVEVVIGG